MLNAGRVAPLPRGSWSGTVNYEMLDIVTYNDIAWIAKRDSLGQTPGDNAYWQRFGSSAPIATTSTAGIVIPDGTTIAVAADGTISIMAGLGDLANVEFTSLTNAQVLAYNATTQKWVNVDISTTLAGLEDVDLTGLQDDQILHYNATTQKWEPTDPPSGGFSEVLIDYDPTEMAGITVTLAHTASAEGHTPETYTITLDNTGEVEQDVKNLGLWTISWTHEGQTYTEEFTIEWFGFYHIQLHEGFTWRLWATAGGIPINQYDSLPQLLADEAAVRRLFIVHDAVDYMCENANSTQNQDLITIINNGLCAKWANLNDYALDNMEADAVLSDLMDDADLYGYGELIEDNGDYVPKGNVPIMTANSAPYGEAFANSSMTSLSRYPYKAFDNDPTTIWMVNTESTGYLGYKFTNPVCVKRVYFRKDTASPNRWQEYKIQASNDGTNWTDLTETLSTETNVGEYTISVNNSNYYLYYRAYCSKTSDNGQPALYTLQFYGRELKVSVPTMTSNTAPYGEIQATSEHSTCQSWKAFNPSEANGWCAVNNAPQSISYTFTRDVKILMCEVSRIGGGSASASTHSNCVFKALEDNVEVEVSDDFDVYATGNKQVIIMDNPVTSKKFIYYINSDTGISAGYGHKLQFYGKDYSEKEFANDGSKWLYDHGVELETIGYSIGTSGRAEDLGQSLYSESNGTQNANRSACYVNFDLTPYSSARVRGVRQATAYATLGVFETPTVTTVASVAANGSKDIPDALGLDISSVNAQKYLSLQTDGNGAKFEVEEWWLE